MVHTPRPEADEFDTVSPEDHRKPEERKNMGTIEDAPEGPLKLRVPQILNETSQQITKQYQKMPEQMHARKDEILKLDPIVLKSESKEFFEKQLKKYEARPDSADKRAKLLVVQQLLSSTGTASPSELFEKMAPQTPEEREALYNAIEVIRQYNDDVSARNRLKRK